MPAIDSGDCSGGAAGVVDGDGTLGYYIRCIKAQQVGVEVVGNSGGYGH